MLRQEIIFIIILSLSGCAPPLMLVGADPTNLPVTMLNAEQSQQFDRGDALFEHAFAPSEGLGPVYIRPSCASCHARDGRGPGVVQRLAVLEADGRTPREDMRMFLPFGDVVRPLFVAPATMGLMAPTNVSNLVTSIRVGPAVFGRGWIEAIDEREILRVAAEQAAGPGPERGVVARLSDGRVGRFGLKARVATLREFAADALRGDMGLTSPIFSTEVANREGLTDDQRPGVDVSLAQVEDLGLYTAAIAIPARQAGPGEGAALFARARCAICHVPSLATRDDYPLGAIAGRPAEVFTDVLLHDMGDALADGVREAGANHRQWRTAPLIGVRHLRSFLHDGRATSLAQAVAMHRGERSEANASIDTFDALAPADQRALLSYVATR
ncbi:MAG: di-heme oxidoredictase family protein [Deltaproteobacteria bacterium]|nr:di-heme oxidoredictase family protein [Deltaproteobacteria bacterium]